MSVIVCHLRQGWHTAHSDMHVSQQIGNQLAKFKAHVFFQNGYWLNYWIL